MHVSYQNNNQKQSYTKEGEIRIVSNPSQTKNSSKEGEYVDYEEIKD